MQITIHKNYGNDIILNNDSLRCTIADFSVRSKNIKKGMLFYNHKTNDPITYIYSDNRNGLRNNLDAILNNNTRWFGDMTFDIENNDLLAYFDINKPKIVIPEKDLVKFKKWYVSYLQTRKQKIEKII